MKCQWSCEFTGFWAKVGLQKSLLSGKKMVDFAIRACSNQMVACLVKLAHSYRVMAPKTQIIKF